MKYLVPALAWALFIPALSSTAQTGTGTSVVRRWSIGVDAGAGVSYRTLSKTGNSATADKLVASRNEREETRVALLGKVIGTYHLSRHWGIEAGFGYSQLGWQQRINTSDLTFGDMIDPRRGFIYQTADVEMPATIILSDIFHYLEFPMGMVLRFGNGHWSSVSALGIAPAVLLEANDRTVKEYDDGDRDRDSGRSMYDFNTINLFPYLSSGIAFRPGERWEWSLRPTARYGAIRIIDTPVTAHLWSCGIGFGFHYAL